MKWIVIIDDITVLTKKIILQEEHKNVAVSIYISVLIYILIYCLSIVATRIIIKCCYTYMIHKHKLFSSSEKKLLILHALNKT